MKVNELKAERVRKQLTQKEMAKKLKITEATYCQKENGTRKFTLNDAKVVSSILSLSPQKICDIFFD